MDAMNDEKGRSKTAGERSRVALRVSTDCGPSPCRQICPRDCQYAGVCSVYGRSMDSKVMHEINTKLLKYFILS